MRTTEYLEDFYSSHDEDARLTDFRLGQVEYLTTRKYLDALLFPACKIAEIGAGTGRYSVTLAQEGYDVTAVELLKINLDVMKGKLNGNENIQIYQGNALKLGMLNDNVFDVTLVLGPLYHLYTEKQQLKALQEAVRITKPGGHLLVSYCMNEATVIQYIFGKDMYAPLIIRDMITEDWHCLSEPEDIFQLMRTEDIEKLNAQLPVERVKLVATDGASGYIKNQLQWFDDTKFRLWLNYHFMTCERQDLIGASNHTLDILRKK